MSKSCEICDGLRDAGLSPDPATVGTRSPTLRVRLVLVEDRAIALCEGHAQELRRSGVDTLEGARQLFTEPDGRRSLLDRRSPLDRRAFPPRPEGRRQHSDRRGDEPEAPK